MKFFKHVQKTDEREIEDTDFTFSTQYGYWRQGIVVAIMISSLDNPNKILLSNYRLYDRQLILKIDFYHIAPNCSRMMIETLPSGSLSQGQALLVHKKVDKLPVCKPNTY